MPLLPLLMVASLSKCVAVKTPPVECQLPCNPSSEKYLINAYLVNDSFAFYSPRVLYVTGAVSGSQTDEDGPTEWINGPYYLADYFPGLEPPKFMHKSGKNTEISFDHESGERRGEWKVKVNGQTRYKAEGEVNDKHPPEEAARWSTVGNYSRTGSGLTVRVIFEPWVNTAFTVHGARLPNEGANTESCDGGFAWASGKTTEVMNGKGLELKKFFRGKPVFEFKPAANQNGVPKIQVKWVKIGSEEEAVASGMPVTAAGRFLWTISYVDSGIESSAGIRYYSFEDTSWPPTVTWIARAPCAGAGLKLVYNYPPAGTGPSVYSEPEITDSGKDWTWGNRAVVSVFGTLGALGTLWMR